MDTVREQMVFFDSHGALWCALTNAEGGQGEIVAFGPTGFAQQIVPGGFYSYLVPEMDQIVKSGKTPWGWFREHKPSRLRLAEECHEFDTLIAGW